jgi:hypothetical protein
MFGLLTCMSLMLAQAPPGGGGESGPKDGVVFTTDDNGKSYPFLFALKQPPPWAIMGKGAVNLV